MVEQNSFHEQLLLIACGANDLQIISTSATHRQQLALDVLTWITALKLHPPYKTVSDPAFVCVHRKKMSEN